jgi:hypothetical protein
MSPKRRRVTLIVGLGVLLVLLVAGAIGIAADNAKKPSHLVGKCITLMPSGDHLYTELDCSIPNDGKVVAVVRRAATCPPGSKAVLRFKSGDGSVQFACLTRITAP